MMKEVAVQRIKPSVHLNEKDLPTIRNWKVGKEYDLIMHVKMMSSNMDIESPDMEKKMKKPMMSGRFEMMSVESPDMEKEMKNMHDNDFTDKKIKRLEEKAKYE